MGVEATMTIGDKKSAAFATVATAAATFPSAGSVRVVTILAGDDLLRKSEIIRAVKALVNYVRDQNLVGPATSIAVATKLDTYKPVIRTTTTAAEIVTGDVALMIHSSTRASLNEVVNTNAHLQCLAAMREQGRLVA